MTWLRDRWHILELNEILWNFVIRFWVSIKQEGSFVILFITSSTILEKLIANSRQPTASLSPSSRALAKRCSFTIVVNAFEISLTSVCGTESSVMVSFST